MKTLFRVYGVLALVSLLVYATTGLHWWAPLTTTEPGFITGDTIVRLILLAFLHLGGVAALMHSFADN